MEKQYKVKFKPSGKTSFALHGTTVLEAAANAGLVIDTPCGGAGTCGKCRVKINEGVAEPNLHERIFFSKNNLTEGWRLACQTRVFDDLTIQVPEASIFGGEYQIVGSSSVGGPSKLQPSIRKVYVELSLPTLADPRPDLLRLEDSIGPFQVNAAMLRVVPAELRRQGYKGTVVISDHRIICFEEGDTCSRCFGVAVDIGTTTVSVSLININTGQEVAMLSRMNPQVKFGDDVLSRITHASSCSHCLEELRQIITDEIGDMISELCYEADIEAGFIYEATIAGNTIMQHLICGVDPSPLGVIPFAPAYGRGFVLSAGELGIPINSKGLCYVFPVIGGFVGGDTVAGVLAIQLETHDGPVLMVDIGTNGEIVLAHNGERLAASTAAGPAFEGARISCGMRGAKGAVEKVVFEEDIHLGVIGDSKPLGICGSGLIDLLAELLRVGIVSPEGRLLLPEELPSELSPSLADRVRKADDDSMLFVLTEPKAGDFLESIYITQRDIRELQTVAGAVRAGFNILLRKAGLKSKDLKTVLIAGGFGGFIRRDKAQRIGLLPADIDHRCIHYVGNISLTGASWALLSLEARAQGEELARQTRHVELSVDEDFQMEFGEAMIFPEPS